MKKRYSFLLSLASGFGLLFALLLNLTVEDSFASTTAPTTTWYVASTGNDANDCRSSATACRTINGAIGKASDGDTIQVSNGTYIEHLTLTKTLTISGTGSAFVFLDGAQAGRVLTVTSGVSVTLQGITVRNGKVTGQDGGGIYNEGTLILQNVAVLSNTTTWEGGGIANTGVLTVTQSTIANNSSSDFAGGIYNYRGNVLLRDVTVRDDTASRTGGGLFLNGGTVTLERVTISGNSAGSSSGAVHIQGSATVTLTNVTISGNAANNVSAMYVIAGSTVTVLNSTIADNNSAGTGALYAIINYGALTFKNTIVANKSGNTAGNCSNGGVLTSLGHNLSDDSTCSFTQTGDQQNTDPRLGPLADNGGHTWTRALLAGSPAIDAGTNNGCPVIDQRGYARPFDGDGDGTAACDIGAYEFSRQMQIGDATVTEGNSGTTTAVFTVTLTPTSTQPVTVTYATADGTAKAGSDYTAASGSLVFPPGQSSMTIQVSVLGDTTDEPNETFTVTLNNAQGAQIVDAQGVGTIIDDDGLPSLVINDATVTEGDSGTVDAVFTVTLSPASGQTVTVDYATADDTAKAGSDYTVASGTLTFNPGETTKTITVTVQGDVVDEGSSERFTVNLSNATHATLYDAQGVGTITDDDTASLAVSNVTVLEGNSGTTPAVFTVTLSRPAAFTVTVDYATANVTALAGSDYITASGTLTFTPGTTRQNVTVQVIGDTQDEPTEYFYLNLSNAQGAPVTDNSGVGYITDDDSLPTLSLGGSQSTVEGDSGTKQLSFVVTLSPASGQTVTVDYATSDGTATAGQDYIAVSGTLTFNPGETTKTISVPILGDTVDEANETFTVTLSNPTNATLATDRATGMILNDDSVVKVSITDASQPEGDSGASNATFTVTLSVTSSVPLTVAYATSDGTATAGQDYTAVSGTLTFNPGETQKTISVPVLGDTLDEANETFTVTLSNLQSSVNAIFSDAQGVGTIVDDDVAPTLRITDTLVTEGNSGTVSALFTVTLSATSGQVVTVHYATADGTAMAGQDYTAVSGTLTFNPGETQKIITVAVLGDIVVEPDETFKVILSNASHATLADAQGQGTILNDDGKFMIFLPLVKR